MVLAEAGKYPEAARMLQRSIEMRPTQYRAWGLLASVYLNQHADATKVRDTYLKSRSRWRPTCGSRRRGTPICSPMSAATMPLVGMEKESLPLLAQAAALAPDIPEVLYQVAVGYEALHHRDEALRWLAKGASGRLCFRSHRAKSSAGRSSRRPAIHGDPQRPSLVFPIGCSADL